METGTFFPVLCIPASTGASLPGRCDELLISPTSFRTTLQTRHHSRILPMAHLIPESAKDPLISTLHEDLLWKIFLFNADLNDDISFDAALGRGQDPVFTTNGLTVTRHTSQVCRFWRSLILGSTSIWGRVIDLNVLKASSQIWRDEVLKRTGEAPLDIKGNLLGIV